MVDPSPSVYSLIVMVLLTLYWGTSHLLRGRLPRPKALRIIWMLFLAVAIAFIGIDGSGKSTLSRRVIQAFAGESCFISDGLELFSQGEPCPGQPLVVEELRQWVGRKSKSAKDLARYKIPKIAELLLRDRLLTELERWYRPDQIFMDGCPLLNLSAWAILYHEECFDQTTCAKLLPILTGQCDLPRNDPILKQLPELNALRRLSLTHLHLPDVVVFLDIDPGVSLERIAARGQRIQAHENLEKLTKLRQAYHMVCNVLEETIPVCRLSAQYDLAFCVRDLQI